MPSPPIQVFLTTIASQPALRQRQEYILRIFQTKKIPFKSYDLASDEQAKRLWKRKAPPDKQQLPGILVGGSFPGTFADFEEAVESKQLDIFLRLNEDYDPSVEDDRPLLPDQPIGVPGAYSPQQMTNQKPSFSTSPSPNVQAIRKDEFDVGTELVGFGLQGVHVTNDDLLELVSELGLGGDEASELVKGLSTLAPLTEKKEVANLKTEQVPVPEATSGKPVLDPSGEASEETALNSEKPNEEKPTGSA